MLAAHLMDEQKPKALSVHGVCSEHAKNKDAQCHGHTKEHHASLLNRQPITTISMKSTLPFLHIAAALIALQVAPVASEPVKVFIIDDQTGEELAVKHGIQPLVVTDMEVVINAVLRGSTPVTLMHQAVDEDSTDNTVAKLDFRPYAGGKPPKAPSPGLPLSQLAKAMSSYRKERTAWQQGIIGYRKDLVSEIERFIKGISTTQLEVSERFDRMLAERNGRDFNRSDILSCIVAANRMLGPMGRRVIVLNTDAMDLPANRVARTTALKTEELATEVELIFVNTSGLPEQAPLFRGLSNPIKRADSAQQALEMICKSFAEAPVTPESNRVTPQ
jgi:hypothetical protein